MKKLYIVLMLSALFSVTGKCDHIAFLGKILKREDVSSEATIPDLERILKTGSTSIHPYAAAQALFLIDTEASRAVLNKWLSYPRYDFDYSIRLAFHWQMEAKKRDAFIKEFHLKGHSEDIEIGIKAVTARKNANGRKFTISLKNRSEKDLRLYKPHLYLGKRILLVSEKGEVMEPHMSTIYSLEPRSPKESYVVIAPGASLAFGFSAKLKTYPDGKWAEYRDVIFFDCGDFSHKLTTAGRFKVYAHYAHCESEESPFDNIWTGRVVSKPLEIEIKEEEIPNKANARAETSSGR